MGQEIDLRETFPAAGDEVSGIRERRSHRRRAVTFCCGQGGVRSRSHYLKRLRELFERQEDFSFETTLTGFGYVNLLREMKAAGYRIRLDYLWIPNLDITRARVKQRVKKGGHDIPDDVQQRLARG
jgi:hypothetical protein